MFIATVTDDLIQRGLKAGDLVREVAKIVGGGGGGQPRLAQAGGKDVSKLAEAISAVPGLVEKAIR
jgi:alanyl-tRNA synthetase